MKHAQVTPSRLSYRVLRLEDFVKRDRCPGCESTALSDHVPAPAFRCGERFPSGRVSFGNELNKCRTLCRCSSCALLYLSHIPAQHTLLELMDGPGLESRWSEHGRQDFDRAKQIMQTYFPSGGSVLDVGANRGDFLSSLDSGWERFALEPMTDSQKQLRAEGVTVLGGFADNSLLPDASFECITAFDVFEHLSHPGECLRRLASALKPGGILVIGTGNAGSRIARSFGPAWYYLNYLEHFQAYTISSLKSALTQVGLRIAETSEFSKHDLTVPDFARILAIRRYPHYGRISAYTPFALFRRPRAWQVFCRFLNGTSDATPPDTGLIERDHLMVIGKRV